MKSTLTPCLLSALMLIVAACSRKPANGTTDSTAASTALPATPSAATPTAVSHVDSAPPPTIARVGELGENAYDAVQANQWSKAGPLADSIASGARTLPTLGGTSAAEMAQTTDSFKAAVARRDRSAALHAANRVTRLAIEMGARYTSAMPSDVMMLDYYGRELELGAAAQDTVALRRTASDIERTWAAVRPAVESHGGAMEAKRFGDLVAQVGGATTPVAYGRLAKPLLDEVDNLEKVFAKH